MTDIHERTKLIYGEKHDKLLESTVMVVGIGGVGSYAVEALARAGVGKLIIVDMDVIEISNINRQIHALHSTVGKAKTTVMKKRIVDINPGIEVHTINRFELDEAYELISDCDYVIDAIDTIKNKFQLIKNCLNASVPIISSMGTGNKVEPTRLEVSSIWKTEYDPVAKKIRKKMRESNDKRDFEVVFSKEIPISNDSDAIGSNSFVPAVSGLIMAGHVINELVNV